MKVNWYRRGFVGVGIIFGALISGSCSRPTNAALSEAPVRISHLKYDAKTGLVSGKIVNQTTYAYHKVRIDLIIRSLSFSALIELSNIEPHERRSFSTDLRGYWHLTPKHKIEVDELLIDGKNYSSQSYASKK